jgi:hypothetical protein
MTCDQFRAALADLGLSQAGFARLAMVDARTMRRWCDGTRAVPGPVVALLRVMMVTDEWQPIETAPKDGMPVLGYADGDMATVVWRMSATYGERAGTWALVTSGSFAEDDRWWPTHWMPLPEAPEERKP